MNIIALIGTVCFLHLLALISPGPDFFMMMKNTLSYSRKSGIYTGLGIALGNFIHILFSFLGIAVIVSQSVLLFNFIKILGAVYLIFIGLKLLISKSSHINISVEKKNNNISDIKSFQFGFFSAVLNPKVTLFYLSIFSLVIPTNTNYVIKIFIGLLLTLNTFIYNFIIANVFSHNYVQKTFSKFQKYFNKFFGGILILLGIKVLLSKK